MFYIFSLYLRIRNLIIFPISASAVESDVSTTSSQIRRNQRRSNTPMSVSGTDNSSASGKSVHRAININQ